MQPRTAILPVPLNMRPKYSGTFKTTFSLVNSDTRGNFDLPEELCVDILLFTAYIPRVSLFSHTVDFISLGALMKTCKFWYRLIRKNLHVWRYASNAYRPELCINHLSFGPNSYFRMLKHIWKQITAQEKPFALTVDGHIGWLDRNSVAMTNAMLIHTQLNIYNQVLLITIGDILQPRTIRNPNVNPVAMTDEFIEEVVNGHTWKYWLQQPVVDFAGSDSGFCMLLETCVMKIGEPNMEGLADPYPIFWDFPPTEKLTLVACGVCTFIVWASNTNTLWGGSSRDIPGGKDMSLVKIAIATNVYRLEANLIPDPTTPEYRIIKYVIYTRDPNAPMNIDKPNELMEASVFYNTNKKYIDEETERANP